MLTADHSFTYLGRQRLKKSAPILEVLGSLDELNTACGLARAFSDDEKNKKQICQIQKDLIQIGGVLAGVAGVSFPFRKKVHELEEKIAARQNPQPHDFSLPGEKPAEAFLHLARTLTRRLERRVVGLKNKRSQPVVAYLNRLSAYLFQLAVREDSENGLRPQ